jgi:hypothetical protein
MFSSAERLTQIGKKAFGFSNLAWDGWGARIRTWEWRYQKPLPYHLATPH